MTCTAAQLFLELLHEEEVVAEARQDSGLVQWGLLDDSLIDFYRADVDVLAEEAWTVGNFQDGE